MNRLPMGLLVLACTGLLACNGEETDTDTDVTCENYIMETYPEDGETAAFYRTTVEVKFDDFEDGATFTVTDAGGTAVTGTQTWVGDRLILEPDAPLTPQTTYTTSIDYSCGTPSVSWTTSEVGGALGTPASLDGRSYLLDLSSGRFVEPEGVGEFLGDYLDQIVLVGVQTATATEIQMLGALGYENTGDSKIYQEPCIPSIDFPLADFDNNPFFTAGPQDTSLSVAGFEVDIQQLMVSGAFGPDGSYISGATLGGKIDTRPIVPLVFAECDEPLLEDGNPNPNYPCDDNAICAFAASLFIECEACAENPSSTHCGCDVDLDENNECPGTVGTACCLSLLVDSIQAAEHLDGGPVALQTLSDLGSGDALTDPCIVNAAQCGGLDECL
jgi:hypothetical protein